MLERSYLQFRATDKINHLGAKTRRRDVQISITARHVIMRLKCVYKAMSHVARKPCFGVLDKV